MILRLGATFATLAVACGLAACSHDSSVACEPTSRYATAATAGPVRIPDDLNPPDETDSLRLPPDPPAVARTKPCLESPPGYYADGAPAPGRNGTGLERRQAPGGGQRPAAAPPPAPAPQPPPAQPPPSDAAPASGDREINN